jgi:uncharacterized membrane protein
MIRSGKALVIALALSLGLNVFLGSFIAARALHRREDMVHGGGPGPFWGLRGLLRDRKGPIADRARALMAQNRDTFHVERGRLHEAQRAVAAALTAEPFDADALARAFAELRETTAHSQQLMHRTLVDLARDLPVEQRRELLGATRAFRHGFAGRGGF